MNQPAKEVISEISRLAAKRNNLLNELSASLDVEGVWPDAFEGGQRCRLRACETGYTWQQARAGNRPEINSAYLQRDDGVCFPITSDQFYQLAREFRT